MFIIRNISGGPVTINDLGLTIDTGQDYTLSQNDQPHEVEESADLRARITAGDLVALDPLDGVTQLNTLQSLVMVDQANSPNFRIFGGVLDQLDDVDTTGAVDGYALVYNQGAGEWQAVENSVLGAGLLGLGPWRYDTDTTPPPSSGRIEFNNANPELATKMYVHYDNNNGNDLTNFLSAVGSSAIFYAQQERDSNNGWIARITGTTDQTTYVEYDVTDVTLLGTALVTNRDYAVVISGGQSATVDERVKVSSNDTTSGFLTDKLVAGTNITLTENNDGGNETLTIASTGGIANSIATVNAGAGTFNATGEDSFDIIGGTGISTTITGDVLTIVNDSPNVDQNLWETITGDSGSTTANTTTDNLTIAGGPGISTAVSGDTITITNDSPNVDQNLWETVTSDSGSTSADTTTDTLTVSGGTGISTSISGDTLTITNDSPNADQNLWETFNADSGSTTANTTTDTATFAGGNGITTSISGDTVTTALTISTIGGQPIPTYTDTTRSNKTLSLETANFVWSELGVGNNDWIKIGEASDATSGYIMPFDGTIIRATGHTEDTNGNTKDIDVYVDAASQGSVGQFTGAGEQEFSSTSLNIDFTAGQKLRLRGRTGQGTIGDTVVSVFVKWRA